MVIFLTVAMAGFANAQVYSYPDEYPGWRMRTHGTAAESLDRADHPGMEIIMMHFPALNQTPPTSQEDLLDRVEKIQNRIADGWPACAPIKGKTAKPNGMGLEVKDRDENPLCFVVIGIANEESLFANVMLDGGRFAHGSDEQQRAALVFIQLTVMRIEGKKLGQ